MEITIGIQHVARELTLEVDQKAEEVAKAVDEALTQHAKGDGAAAVRLTDTKGRQVVVPASSLGYIEIGAQTPRPVGFGNA